MTATNYPKVSFITPTLNAAKQLPNLLDSIKQQKYPAEKIEIVIADGGSKDKTREIALSYGAKIYENKYKTSESGKAVCVDNATGDYLIFTDADNILVSEDWIEKMISPLEQNEHLIGAEPIEYTYRETDGVIDRYCALMGMNDPICYWLGSYDRKNILSGKWTGLKIEEIDKGTYLELHLRSGNIPTIGANGTVFRTSAIKNKGLYDTHLFDMDLLETLAAKQQVILFAKVKTGIVHTYCGSNLNVFIKKQTRRVMDYLHRETPINIFVKRNLTKRKYTYGTSTGTDLFKKIATFGIYCILVIPLIGQSISGYTRKRDIMVWLAHPVLCWVTLITYSYGVIANLFYKGEYSREKW